MSTITATSLSRSTGRNADGTVTATWSPVARPLAWLLGLATAPRPASLRIERAASGETWRRRFGPRTWRTTVTPAPTPTPAFLAVAATSEWRNDCPEPGLIEWVLPWRLFGLHFARWNDGLRLAGLVSRNRHTLRQAGLGIEVRCSDTDRLVTTVRVTVGGRHLLSYHFTETPPTAETLR